MIVKQLNISESKLAWDDWLSSNYKIPVIDDEYEAIRIELVKAYNEIKNSLPSNSARIKYLTDIKPQTIKNFTNSFLTKTTRGKQTNKKRLSINCPQLMML